MGICALHVQNVEGQVRMLDRQWIGAGVLLYMLVFGLHPFVDMDEVQTGSFKNTYARIVRSAVPSIKAG